MEALTSYAAAGTNDLERAIDLLQRCRAVASIDPWPSIYQVRHQLHAIGAGQLADTRLWENRAGVLMAFAMIWDGAISVSCMHPYAQCDDLAQQIVVWGMERTRERARHCGDLAMLFVPIGADDWAGRMLLERHGFVPQDWSIHRMARPLDKPLPPCSPPSGFTLRPIASDQELAAALAIDQEIAGAGPVIAHDRRALLHEAADVEVLDLVALAPDGELAAFCLCSTSCQGGMHSTSSQGWIDLLGTHPAYQRRGIGRAILLAGLQQLHDHHANVALLGTTSWNVTAQRLFTSVGFDLVRQIRWYAWEDVE